MELHLRLPTTGRSAYTGARRQHQAHPTSEIDALISTCCQQWVHFAEAEGPKGARIRTWVDTKDRPFIAWGGSAEWGPAYSGGDDRCERRNGAAPRSRADVPVRERKGHLAQGIFRQPARIPGAEIPRQAHRGGAVAGALGEEAKGIRLAHTRSKGLSYVWHVPVSASLPSR
jgi:hypothetical protein